MTNITKLFKDQIWKANYVGEDFIANIGLPIFLLLVSIGSIVWFFIEVKRKTIRFRNLVSWFTLSIFFLTVVVYVLIVTSLQVAGVDRAVNIFDWVSHYLFGFNLDAGKEWIFILLLALSAYLLVASLRNSIRISRFEANIDKLNKKIAILAGKLEKTDKQTKKPKNKK